MSHANIPDPAATVEANEANIELQRRLDLTTRMLDNVNTFLQATVQASAIINGTGAAAVAAVMFRSVMGDLIAKTKEGIDVGDPAPGFADEIIANAVAERNKRDVEAADTIGNTQGAA